MENKRITKENIEAVRKAVIECLSSHGWKEAETTVFDNCFTIDVNDCSFAVETGDFVMYLSNGEAGGMIAYNTGYFLSIQNEYISSFSFDGEKFIDGLTVEREEGEEEREEEEERE